MHQPELIRRHIVRYLSQNLRIYVSLLSPLELDALKKLQGNEGIKTAAKIADIVLTELGHEAPSENAVTKNNSASTRAARQMIAK